MVTREPRFTDAERATLLTKLEHDDGLCSGCGIHAALIDADDVVLSPGHRVCEFCAASDQYHRILHEADETESKKHRDRPAGDPRPEDGRHPRIQIRPKGG